MEINVNNVGQYGVIIDPKPFELPLNAWTDARNIRFSEQGAEKISGHRAVMGAPSVAPYWLLTVPQEATYYWLYAGLLKVYATDGTTHSNITRQTVGVDVDYNATADARWTGGVLGGIPILNNPNDDPQMWNPAQVSQRLQLLTNWPANTKTFALRPFRNFLIALDVVKSGTRYPTLVKWSHPADPGTVPTTWDPTDATKKAGEFPLSDTPDFVIDCATLRDINVIYKNNTTWGMQFVGGVSVFRFFKMFDQFGLLGRSCMVEFFDGRHVAFGPDDAIVHDGQNAESILTRRMRKYLYNRIDGANGARSFVMLNLGAREVWLCYPLAGASFASEAVVWNFNENTLTVRDLPNIAHGTIGVVVITGLGSTWDTDTGTWDTDVTPWNESTFNPADRSIVWAGATDTKLYEGDATGQFNGVDFSAKLERTGIGIPGRDVNTPPDITSRKQAQRVWPRITGTLNGVVNISVGAQERPQDAPTYGAPQPFTIGVSKFIETNVNGALLAVKLESSTNIEWRLDGYTLDIVRRGKY